MELYTSLPLLTHFQIVPHVVSCLPYPIGYRTLLVYILRKRGQISFYFNYILSKNKIVYALIYASIKFVVAYYQENKGEMSIKFVD